MDVDGNFTTEDPEKWPALGVNKWQRLVLVAQWKRRSWANMTALKYAKNGMPKNLDGPAKGFGRHLGRWQWREIASHW